MSISLCTNCWAVPKIQISKAAIGHWCIFAHILFFSGVFHLITYIISVLLLRYAVGGVTLDIQGSRSKVWFIFHTDDSSKSYTDNKLSGLIISRKIWATVLEYLDIWDIKSKVQDCVHKNVRCVHILERKILSKTWELKFTLCRNLKIHSAIWSVHFQNLDLNFWPWLASSLG